MTSSFGSWILAVILFFLVTSESKQDEIICDAEIQKGFLECFSKVSLVLQEKMTDCGQEALKSTTKITMKEFFDEGCNNEQILADGHSCCLKLLNDTVIMEEINRSKNDQNVKDCFEELDHKAGVYMWFK